jgi:hypothetical protein
MLAAVATALAGSVAAGIALRRMMPVQVVCGFDFRGSLRFSWLAPGPPWRRVLACLFGIEGDSFP